MTDIAIKLHGLTRAELKARGACNPTKGKLKILLNFLKVKEAELMEAQRLEDARVRRNAEIDRRMMQTRLQKTTQIQEEKRSMARAFAKRFLNNFKRDTLKILTD